MSASLGYDARTRRNQYFVPGDGISREVITSDICKYLDNDATVKPGKYEGREGFYVYAYRNLTTAMIEDLQTDSAKWEDEKKRMRRDRDRGGHSHGGRSGGRGPVEEYSHSRIAADRDRTERDRTQAESMEYANSRTMGERDRAMNYPGRENPSPQYPGGTRAPQQPGEYRPTGQPLYNEPQYVAQTGAPTPYSQPQHGYPNTYDQQYAGQDPRQPRGYGDDYHSQGTYGAYPQDPQYGYQQTGQPAQRGYPAQPQPGPPNPQRGGHSYGYDDPMVDAVPPPASRGGQPYNTPTYPSGGGTTHGRSGGARR